MGYMIDDPKTYFTQMTPKLDDPLPALEREARTEDLPIVGPAVGGLLTILTGIMGAEKVLEIGTCTGYSGICLIRGVKPGGRLVTLERNDSLADRAESNFKKAGYSGQVEIRRGEALDTLADLCGPFDLVFLDIEKDEYAPALSHIRRLLRPGGLLLADNTAFDDARPFNRAVSEDPAFRVVHLYSFLPGHSPNYDALTMAMKTE